MATVSPVVTRLVGNYNEHEGYSILWETLTTTNDTGVGFEKTWSDRSVQVTGTFGSGGNVKIQGSNEGTTWAILTDPQGNDLDIAAAKIEQITEITRYIRPFISAGDGATDLDVTILVARKYK